jgi:hypothetical protein
MPALPLEMAFVEALEGPPTNVQPAAAEARQAVQPAQSTRPEPQRPARQPNQSPPALPAEPEPVPEALDEPADPQSNRKLDENWKQILSLTRQADLNTYSLINSSRSRNLHGSNLTLGFASDVLKEKMEKSSNLELVQKVLHQVLGLDVEIRCVTLSGKRTNPPPGVDSDGMVASALRDLGGEIVDVH